MNLFITAGIGSEDLLQAAERLKRQIDELKIFDASIVVTERDLAEIAPWIFTWYSAEELKTNRGYGFYAWKPAIAKAATDGFWGDADVICYLDAGCEILPGHRSKRIIKNAIKKSKKFGVVGFSSFTPEWKFTKTKVLGLFPDSQGAQLTSQFQSGTWFLSGTVGAFIANEWNEICSASPEITNEEISVEAPGFVAHRHDQSVFSMVLKRHAIEPESLPTPHPNRRFIPNLTALRSPIWAARNRSGNTIIPRHVRMIARLLP